MINSAVNFIKSQTSLIPKIGIILGTGLNSLADMVENSVVIPYNLIPGFKTSTAPSHSGKLIIGKIGNANVILMQGRLHFYEGYKMSDIVFPIRVMKKLGISHLFVTNASGSLNVDFTPGSLVLLKNHINFMGTNPLIGENLEEFGERFPSMNDPYNAALRELAMNIAIEKEIKLHTGVYVAVSGPSLETKSESLMLQGFGADLVGMSTVPEVIVAVHSGIKVLAISVVTNYSNIFHSQAHSQEEIRENALKAKTDLETLILSLIKNI
jgi:purine-nucleoside phosphorylase